MKSHDDDPAASPPPARDSTGRGWLGRVPGFRSGNPLKGILATLGYLVMALLVLRVFSGAVGSSSPPQPSVLAAVEATVHVEATQDVEATVNARVQATLAAGPTTPPAAAPTTPPTVAPTPVPPTVAPATATPPPVAQAVVIPTPATGVLYDVVDVVDGDTIKVRSAGGPVETVRLIGMDTPEVVDPRTPVQCFGRESSARAKQLLSGQRVRLEQDPTQDSHDRYGRLLAYVWLEDGTFFNKQMILDGYAQEYTFRTPYRFQAEFKAAQQQAREAQRGLWAPDTCNGDTTQPADTGAPTRTPTSRPGSAPATPTPPSAGATVTGAVQIVSAVGARPGGTARVTAKAPPGASCSITYTTPAGTPSTAQGLVNRTADAAGNVSWSWSIGTGTRQGTGSVTVTCNGVTAGASITIG